MAGPGIQVIYDSEMDSDLTRLADPQVRQVATQLTAWVNQARAVTNRTSLFDRAAYIPSDNPYEQMRTARAAVASDDIVGGVAEVTEGLAFDGVKWESAESDEADIFNQMAEEQNLDNVVRQMHRELFSCSQAYVGFWWDRGRFKVRGKTEAKNARKKTYDVWYPRAITSLDPARIVPVGMMQFGQERLAWQATQLEIAQYMRVVSGDTTDELMATFYAGQYVPADQDELTELTAIGVDVSRLVLLSDEFVKRHTLTKQDYARFPDIRMRRVFKMLDLKQQLMEADRVSLIGAANYILLVKKGTKEDPAYPEEITNLQQNFSVVAKLPVVISDHRLEIEIITPKQDFTLLPEKYDVLDNRIAATLLGLFGAVGSRSGNRGDTSLQEGRLVARALENRRHMIRRFLEREISRAVMNHPKNVGVFQGEPPNLSFVPSRIELDSDAGFLAAVIQLRTMNELSRESTLELFGFDQAVEAMRRDLEKSQGLDDTFQTMVPFSSPTMSADSGVASGSQAPPPVAQGANGARGGRPAGGGKPSQNPASAPRRTSKGTTGTKGA